MNFKQQNENIRHRLPRNQEAAVMTAEKTRKGKRMRRRMMQAMFVACSVAFATAPGALADDQKHEKQNQQQHATAKDKSQDSSEFIRGALDANKLEIQAAELAFERAEHEQVKDLARSIADQHKWAQRELKKIAANHNIQGSRGLEERHKQKLDEFKQAQGREFDKAYIRHVINDHQRDIAALKECSGKFENMPELQSLIERSLPEMQDHLVRARNINQNAQLGIALDEQQERDTAQGAAASIDIDTARESDRVEVEGDDNYGPGTGVEFRKGDNEVLGLPTRKDDGTILGIVPAPSATVEAGDERSYIAEELQDGKVDPQVDSTRDADTDTVVETDQSERP